MIEAHELTECYGDIHAVHSLSVTIAPGTVTGFPGPNGAGKPATMRMIMGLGRPTSGTVTVNGKPYQQHRAPLREVRALLEASAVHPGRSARSHLRSMAATHKIKASRVSEVIEMTGLAGVATKRVAGFSLGMASAWTSPPPPRRPQDAHPRRAGQRAADVDGRAVSAAIAGANAPGRGPLHPQPSEGGPRGHQRRAGRRRANRRSADRGNRGTAVMVSSCDASAGWLGRERNRDGHGTA
jgi:ABC transporter